MTDWETEREHQTWRQEINKMKTRLTEHRRRPNTEREKTQKPQGSED